MFCKNLFSVISLALFVFIGNTAFAGCPSADVSGDCRVDLEDFAIVASQWLDEGDSDPDGMVWVYINELNFTGEMSKYETTNAQYAEYLNSALDAGEITVYSNVVFASDDGSHSKPYFALYPAFNSQITFSGGFSVRSRDGYDMSNHPVVMVTWFGAAAFCNYYGYRLPTEGEWQVVADYDGSYTYGCGISIDHSKANYYNDNPLGLSSEPYTSPVGYYPAYGYGMCDMAGNVLELTSGCYLPGCNGSLRVIRGGSWDMADYDCTVSGRGPVGLDDAFFQIGFRVCR